MPLVDLAAVGGVQIQMLRRLSQIYGVPFSKNRGKALIAGFAGTMIPATTGIGMASFVKKHAMDRHGGRAGIDDARPARWAPLTQSAWYSFSTSPPAGHCSISNPPDYREFHQGPDRQACQPI